MFYLYIRGWLFIDDLRTADDFISLEEEQKSLGGMRKSDKYSSVQSLYYYNDL